MENLEKIFWVLFYLTFAVLFVYIAVHAIYSPSTGMESITMFVS